MGLVAGLCLAVPTIAVAGWMKPAKAAERDRLLQRGVVAQYNGCPAPKPWSPVMSPAKNVLIQAGAPWQVCVGLRCWGPGTRAGWGGYSVACGIYALGVVVSLLLMPMVMVSLCILNGALNERMGWILGLCVPFIAAALALRISGLLACLPPPGDFDGGDPCSAEDCGALQHVLAEHPWLVDFMAVRGVDDAAIMTLPRGAVRWLVGAMAFFDRKAAMAGAGWVVRLRQSWRQHRAYAEARRMAAGKARVARDAGRGGCVQARPGCEAG